MGPPPDVHEDPATDPPNFQPVIDDIKIAKKYIDALKDARLDSDLEPLSDELLEQIRNPDQEILSLDNPDNRLSIDIYLAVGNASVDSYNTIRDAILRRYPSSGVLSYYKVQKLVTQLSGVTPVWHDMCIDSCMAYTGPLAELESCMFCGKSRWREPAKDARGGDGGEEPPPTKRVPQQQFMTLLISPQLQALWRTKEGAQAMQYRKACTEQVLRELDDNGGRKISPYTDFFHGRDYIDAVRREDIQDGDTVLMMSVDGAQLYRNKASDCWIQIWVIMDLAPEERYKKHRVAPGTFIPGPNKPKLLDSFLFPGLYHLRAVMAEGLAIWDANSGQVFTSHPYLALVSADGPGMACLNGFVGHNGKCHCRLYCPLKGRHKQNGKTYYPARQKPDNYDVHGCDHPDVDLMELLRSLNTEETQKRYKENLERVEASPNASQYAKRRLETGLCKPTIFSAFPSDRILGVPGCFCGDVMHLPCLNIPDLMIPLWRGTFECDKSDNRDEWEWRVLPPQAFSKHGKHVDSAKKYLPGSYGRAPRNPAEKISSGYKAWEFLIWFYYLGPALFHLVLPFVYWVHYCKLVRAIRLLLQEEITPDEVQEANTLLVQFSDDFENLYVQRRADRLHFVRPSVHAPSHLPGETVRIGPGIISSQWTMERTIGNLGEEIRQHSDPYANLAERGLRRCQLNALKAMLPDLEPSSDPLPKSACDVGRGYALLAATDNCERPVTAAEAMALKNYLESKGESVPTSWHPRVVRWARAALPNGQIARSRWKEEEKSEDDLRRARCVKLEVNGKTEFAEIHYFFLLDHGHIEKRALALASFFGPPDQQLYQDSSKTFYSCEDRADMDVRVVELDSVKAVIGMVLDERKTVVGALHKRWYLVEKPGLKVFSMIGLADSLSSSAGTESAAG
uniref:Uncharacterized protein n=2 Tax=Schizophyllum commune (strain H4-8 / FGSC 9210) TaxID=578458 RepID=D8PU20_SCHCM